MAYTRRYQTPKGMAPQPRYRHQETWKSIPCPGSVSPSETRWRSVRHWEERFGMNWRRFLTSKTCTSEVDNVMVWDDSAAKESFFEAERRFWSTNCLSSANLPSPDLYIDCIDWDSRIDPLLLMEFEAARQNRKGVPAMESTYSRPCTTGWEDVKPTGWEVCGDDWSRPRVLTGMIVGGTGEYENLHDRDEYHVPFKSKQQPGEIFDQVGESKSSNFTAGKQRYRGNHRGRWGFDNHRTKSKNFRECHYPGAVLIV